jgi:SpoVK/Ycf46/Vps4 family AAA+-type ATPase
MPLSNLIKTFLKPLKIARMPGESQLAPGINKQLKSVARQLRENNEHIVLFTGASETEKNYAASFIGELSERNVYKIDLSNLVSKYIGETEKNLARLLSTDSKLDAVLLFDEADSLFGKRTEISSANDRYANVNTNHLLHRLEAFKGIAILASNVMDDSFLRNVNLVVEFTRPPKQQRRSPGRRVSVGKQGSYSKRGRARKE